MADGKTLKIVLGFEANGADRAERAARSVTTAVDDLAKKLKRADFSVIGDLEKKLRGADFGAGATKQVAALGNEMSLTRQQALALTYTFNDVTASLASGASPFTILLQQGGQVTQAFGGIRQTVSTLLPYVARLAPAFAAVGAAVAAISFVRMGASAAEAAVEIGKLADKAGVSLAAFQRLSAAGRELNNIPAQSIADGLARLKDAGLAVSKVWYEGSRDTSKSLTQLQDEANKAAGVFGDLFPKNFTGTTKEVGQAVLDLADRIKAIQDPVRKALVIRELKRELGDDFVRLLEGGARRLVDLANAGTKAGTLLTDAQRKAAEEYVRVSGRISAQSDALSAKLWGIFTPAATAFEKFVEKINTDSGPAFQALSGYAQTASNAIRAFFLILAGDDRVAQENPAIKQFVDGLSKAKDFAFVVGDAISFAFNAILIVADVVAAVINDLFGTKFSAGSVLAVAAIAKVTGAVSLLGAALRAVATGAALSGVATSFASIASAAGGFLSLIPTLIGWPALLIAGAAAAGVAIAVFWDDIAASADRAWFHLKRGAELTWQDVKSIATAALDAIRNSTAWQALGNGWQAVKDAAASAWDFIRAQFASGRDLAVSVWSSIVAAADAGWSALKSGVESVWSYISGVFAKIAAGASQALSTLGNALVPGAQAATAQAPGTSPATPVAGGGNTSQAADQLVAAFQSAQVQIGVIIEAINVSAATAVATIAATFAPIADALIAAFQTGYSGIETILSAVQGLVAGAFESLYSALAGVSDSINSLIANLISQLEAALARIQEIAAAAQEAAAAAGSASSGGDSGKGFAWGGYIRGPGTETSDSIPAWLSRGEFVVRAAAVRKYGVSLFRALNGMSLHSPSFRIPRFAAGGSVGGPGAIVPTLPSSGLGGGGSLANVTLVMPGGQSISGLKATSSALQQIVKAGARKSVASAGREPSWGGY